MATSFVQRLTAPPTAIPKSCLVSARSFGARTAPAARPHSVWWCEQHTAAAAAAAAARRASTCVAAAPGQQSYSAAPDAAPELPTAAYGQVISAEANFVRVNLSHVEPTHSSSSSSSSNCSNCSDAAAPPVKQLLCTVRALLKKIGQRVLVGDNVRVHPIDWPGGRGVVDSVQPRSSELADPAVANVDHVLLLFGLTQPPFEPAQVSRFLVSLGASGLPVTLALNKADLLSAAEIQERLDQVASWGYAAVAVSCETGLGLEALAKQLAGKVSVVAGPSGAGKSSLINALRLGRHKPEAGGVAGVQADAAAAAAGVRWQYGPEQPQQQQQQQHQQREGQDYWPPGSSEGSSDVSSNGSSCCSSSDEVGLAPSSSSSSSSISSSIPSPTTSSSSSSGSFLAVGDVSRIGRGRHTTRTVTLIQLPFGGLMADTPGFNQPTLDRVGSSELAGLFPEFRAAQEEAGGCRFADCMHLAEPGCAVTAADLERHEHYVKFLAEVKAREDFDVRAMQLTKQRREGVLKAKTGRGGETRYEARLNSKKHRSTSRRSLKQRSVWGDEEEDGMGVDEAFREDR